GHVGVLLPDVHRLMGQIHADLGRPEDAESEFRNALETAAGQRSLSLELRAALSYLELLATVGRRDEGIRLVRQHYERFEEGLSQPDLVRARSVLEEAAALEGTAR